MKAGKANVEFNTMLLPGMEQTTSKYELLSPLTMFEFGAVAAGGSDPCGI